MARKYSKKSSHRRQSKKQNIRRSRKHRGGSPASDRVMSFATGAGVQSETPGTPRLTADPKALNLYQTTGGARRLKGGFVSGKKNNSLHGGARRSKSKSRSCSHSRKSRRHMKRGGGATDFRDTLYSRSVDGRSDEVPFFNAFTSEKYLSPQELINEPNMVANPPYLQ
jgi:hypothetical protein